MSRTDKQWPEDGDWVEPWRLIDPIKKELNHE